MLRPGLGTAQKSGVQIGGPFALTNGAGKPVTDRDFRGRFMLVYFGYTHCPDACPTTLSDIGAALDKLPKEARARVGAGIHYGRPGARHARHHWRLRAGLRAGIRRPDRQRRGSGRGGEGVTTSTRRSTRWRTAITAWITAPSCMSWGRTAGFWA
ncbi:MAG: SCO family protein [Rhodospirillales bacterium]